MGWRKGDVIVRADPFAHVLSKPQRAIRCDNCFTQSTNLKRCTACRVLYYCNSKCQRADWPLHRIECRCLKRVSPKIPTESARLMLRILIRIKSGDHTKLDWDTVDWRKFTDLQEHVKEILLDKERSELFAQMTLTLTNLAADDLDLPNNEELLEVFGKMVINTFSICDGELQPVGTGLYISPSLLDHSCDPNAVAVFCGTTLTVTCVRDIPNTDPKQVYISYIDQLAPSTERVRQLLEQYYFSCGCRRCVDPELDGWMLSAQCPHTSCGGVLLARDGEFSPCSICSSQVTDTSYASTVRHVMEESKQTIAKLDELKKHGDEASTRLDLCVKLLRKQRVLSLYNVYKVKVLDRAMDACIDGCQWQQAAEYGEQTIKPHLRLQPACSPGVAIQLMKLGKLQLYLHQLAAAATSLQQAEDILGVTHGRSHPIYLELVELLHQCAGQRQGILEHDQR